MNSTMTSWNVMTSLNKSSETLIGVHEWRWQIDLGDSASRDVNEGFSAPTYKILTEFL
jgi:hypothetical protein